MAGDSAGAERASCALSRQCERSRKVERVLFGLISCTGNWVRWTARSGQTSRVLSLSLSPTSWSIKSREEEEERRERCGEHSPVAVTNMLKICY